ncbi:MAG: hypothetical protein WD771_00230 [Gemmatimonadaceae bacterium]
MRPSLTRVARRLASGLLPAALASACFAYQPVAAPPAPGALPEGVRITRDDGSVVVLAVAEIKADTIRGFRENSTFRVVIPMADVRLMEVLRLQPRETAIGVAIGVGVTAWIVFRIANRRSRPVVE